MKIDKLINLERQKKKETISTIHFGPNELKPNIQRLITSLHTELKREKVMDPRWISIEIVNSEVECVNRFLGLDILGTRLETDEEYERRVDNEAYRMVQSRLANIRLGKRYDIPEEREITEALLELIKNPQVKINACL